MSDRSNIQRLQILRVSQTITQNRNVVQMVKTMADGEMTTGLQDAAAWVAEAIRAVRAAPDGADLGDDETIAGMILERMYAKNPKLRWRCLHGGTRR